MNDREILSIVDYIADVRAERKDLLRFLPFFFYLIKWRFNKA